MVSSLPDFMDDLPVMTYLVVTRSIMRYDLPGRSSLK